MSTLVKNTNPIKLDYTLEKPEERVALVRDIIEQTPPEFLTNKYLEKMSDYIIFAMTKEEKKQRKILTENRKKVIKEREIGLESFCSQKEDYSGSGDQNALTGYDVIYNKAIDGGKGNRLTLKYKRIDEEDIENIPYLKNVYNEIQRLKEVEKNIEKGKGRYSLHQNIIDLSKDQYVIRQSYQRTVGSSTHTIKTAANLKIYENVKPKEDGTLEVDSNISLLLPNHVSALLCNYSALKQECDGRFELDMYYMLLDLENLVTSSLADFPLYYDLLVYKIDGRTNIEIQEELQNTFGIHYSIEYISSLWRKKIPKMIAEAAQREWLSWHYTEEEKGYWKKCNRCGQIKLGHTKFFSKNKSSKDGWYSICKDCRNTRKVGKVKD